MKEYIIFDLPFAVVIKSLQVLTSRQKSKLVIHLAVAWAEIDSFSVELASDDKPVSGSRREFIQLVQPSVPSQITHDTDTSVPTRGHGSPTHIASVAFEGLKG